MSRRSLPLAGSMGAGLRGHVLAPLCALALAAPLSAQDPQDPQDPLKAQTGEPPQSIDILIEPETDEDVYETCQEDQDAATITGEIVVCRRRSGDSNRLYNDDEAKRRHAERTMHQNDPQAPEMFGIPNHGPVVARGCFIPPCPPPPAYIVDFGALPDTPAGSDADRVARGLAPRGRDAPPQGAATQAVVIAEGPGVQDNAAELGLPAPAAEISPSESASPVEEPSG